MFTRGIKSGAIHFAIWIILIVTAVFLLKDQLATNVRGGLLGDLLPYATSAYKDGKPIPAIDVAKQALESAEYDRVEIKKQAGAQLAFGYFLVDDESAKQRCEIIAKQLEATGISRSDPVVETLRFLSNDDYSPDYLRKRMIGEAVENQAIASMAIFIRALYNRLPPSEWMADWTEYTSQSVKEGHWILAWRHRASDLWYKWIMMGQGAPDDLEPLIAKSKTKSISAQSGAGKPLGSITNITASMIAEKRGFADVRPKSDSLSFSQEEFTKYLDCVPKDAQEAEKARFEYVSQVKAYLVKLFKTNPQFQFNDGKILLRSGEVVVVSSILPSQDQLMLNLKNGEKQKIKWSELDPKQLMVFLESFAEKKLQVNDHNNKSSFAAGAAEDYLFAAVVGDWHGDYEDAVRYIKKAVSVDPGATRKAEKLFLQ